MHKIGSWKHAADIYVFLCMYCIFFGKKHLPGRRHLGFLEPEVTIFGREGRNLAIPDNCEPTEPALLAIAD